MVVVRLRSALEGEASGSARGIGGGARSGERPASLLSPLTRHLSPVGQAPVPAMAGAPALPRERASMRNIP